MSAPENIARRLAARFEPEIDARLPLAVERAIEEGIGAESPFMSVDPNQVIAFASFAVSVASAVWTVHMGLWQQAQAQVAGTVERVREEQDRVSGELEQVKNEQEALRQALREALEEKGLRFPRGDEDLHKRFLDAAVDAAIDEAVDEVERRAHR